MVQNYPAPDSGNESVPSAGNSQPPYGAPTPHAAAVAHEPYTAPTGGAGLAGVGELGAGPSSHGGYDAMENGHAWGSTPGEAAEMPERYDET